MRMPIGQEVALNHLATRKAQATFYDLHKLQPGDTVTVESGDGHKYTYKVVQTKIYQADKVNMSEVLAHHHQYRIEIVLPL